MGAVPLQSQLGNGFCLPVAGDLLWMRFPVEGGRGRSVPVIGAVTRVDLNSGSGGSAQQRARLARCVRIIYSDGAWEEPHFTTLEKRKAHRVSPGAVCPTAVVGIRAAMQLMADGRYEEPDKVYARLYLDKRVPDDFLGWSAATWRTAGMTPIIRQREAEWGGAAGVAFGAPPSRHPQKELKLLSHNVSGFRSRQLVFQLFSLWWFAGAQVVAVQETWANRPPGTGGQAEATIEAWFREAAAQHGAPDPTFFWGSHLVGDPSIGNNGVAIIILCPSPLLVPGQHAASPDGRAQFLQIEWGGHSLPLLNQYWPSQSASARASWLPSQLIPFCTSQTQAGLLPSISDAVHLADWNFTAAPHLDRLHAADSTIADDLATSQLWQQAAPDLLDTLRILRPGKRCFTFHHGDKHARLDRILVPQHLGVHVASAAVLHSPVGDHSAAVVVVRALVPGAKLGPGRCPVPRALPKDPAASATLVEWCTEAAAFGCTLQDVDLVQWVPSMLSALRGICNSLARQVGAKRALAASQLEVKVAAVETAESALTNGVGGEGAQAAFLSALADLRETSAAAAAPAALSARVADLLGGERPSTAVTAALRPPQSSSSFPAIRNPATGELVQDPKQISEIMADYFAGISAAPVTVPASKEAVLTALAADIAQGGSAARIKPEAAEAAGSPVITVDEVKAALAELPMGSSAGPDGLPNSIWRLGNDSVWPEFLARLFSAMAATDSLPTDFNLGSLSPLLKPGQADPLSPKALRPIQLLDTLYRILARILCRRFQTAFGPAIGEEQCGFLAGRHIGDAILLCQLLPQLLAAEGTPAALVALDIAKAFDSVDRPFLLEALKVLGASDGMIAWVRLLLRDTQASVQANGYESSRRAWLAGVRQGCPLSPVLYLIVGQALASWLRAHPQLGVVAGGERFVSSHLADDSNVFLSLSAEAQATLLTALITFGEASGQKINVDKSKALLIGAPLPEGQAPFPSLAGIPVLDTITSLGIPLTSQPPLPPPLQQHAHATRAAGRLPLHPAPPQHPAVASALTQRIASSKRMLGRIRHLDLSVMGKGMLTSSYALSTSLYLSEFAGLPGPAALADLGASVAATVGPGMGLSILSGKPKEGGFAVLPLEQHITARHAAHALHLLTSLLPSHCTSPPWTRVASGLLHRACPHLHPAQALLLATETPQADVSGGILTPADIPQVAHIPAGPLRRMTQALCALGSLSLPPTDPPVPSPSVREILTAPPAFGPGAQPHPSIAHLTWAALPTHNVVDGLRVRDITAVLARPLEQQRAARHAAFVAEATSLGAAGPEGGVPVPPLGPIFKRVWGLPIDNKLKEIFFRLAARAIPGGHIPAWTCPCSPGLVLGSACSRLHTFWSCPLAVAVRAELERVLLRPVSLTSLWLLQPPAPSVRQIIWDLACLAALGAMEQGRRSAWAPQAALLAAPAPAVQAASVVATFWRLLDECITPPLEAELADQPLGVTHPFLHSTPAGLAVTDAPAQV